MEGNNLTGKGTFILSKQDIHTFKIFFTSLDIIGDCVNFSAIDGSTS